MLVPPRTRIVTRPLGNINYPTVGECPLFGDRMRHNIPAGFSEPRNNVLATGICFVQGVTCSKDLTLPFGNRFDWLLTVLYLQLTKNQAQYACRIAEVAAEDEE